MKQLNVSNKVHITKVEIAAVSTGRRRGAERSRRGLCAGAPWAMKEPPAGRYKILTVIGRCQCTVAMGRDWN